MNKLILSIGIALLSCTTAGGAVVTETINFEADSVGAFPSDRNVSLYYTQNGRRNTIKLRQCPGR
jgi:hypothetical protein